MSSVDKERLQRAQERAWRERWARLASLIEEY